MERPGRPLRRRKTRPGTGDRQEVDRLLNLLAISRQTQTPRARLKRQTLLAVLATFVLSLAMTAWLWRNSHDEARRAAAIRFSFQNQLIELALRQRLEAYHQILRGGVALFFASKSVSRTEWGSYVEQLQLEKNYPGIQGVGYALWIWPEDRNVVIESVRREGFPEFKIWPEGERDAYTAILYLEPFDWRNQRAFGYDMYSEPVRRNAMARARDEGTGVASDIVVLVQETDVGVQYGFNLYLPVYEGNTIPETLEERRQRLQGFVYSPFRIEDLLEGALIPHQLRDTRLQIYDIPDAEGVEPITSEPPGIQIYDSLEADAPDEATPSLFEETMLFEFAHQRWLLRFTSRPPFEAAARAQEANLILAGGTLVSGLFASIVGFWGANRDRAKALARTNQDLQQALRDRRQAEQNLDRLFALAPDMLCVLNHQGRISQVNPAFRALLGYNPGELIGHEFASLFHEEDRDKVKRAIQGAGMDFASGSRLELRGLRRDGSDCWIEWSFVTAAREGFLYAYGRDVTERRESELNRRRLAAVLEGTADVIFFTDPQGRLLYLNRKGRELFALDQQPGHLTADALCPESAQRQLRDVAFPAAASRGFWRGETCIQTVDGRELPMSLILEAQFTASGEVEFYSAIMHDISERKAYEDRLRHQASHDALTGLVNRREFEARLARALESTTTRHTQHALLYIDLDHFKVVNDACGHAAGDDLLRQLARLFSEQIRERDTLARLGGDEFGLFMEHCPPGDALRVANKLLNAVKNFGYPCRGQLFRVGLSIGLVPINHENNSLKQVLNQADHACYIAKEGGRNRVVVHQVGAEEIVHRREEMNWASRLNAALQEEQFRLCYQPIAPLAQPGGRGHWEILLRLLDEEGELISPVAFLTSAERFGLMPAIDRWVVAHTLDYLSRHPLILDQLDMVTINVSAKALSDEHFYQYVVERLEESGLDPAKICLEITETAAIGNLQTTLSFMRRLKERGVRFALDDFGTGMASFSYLKMLPVDYIKIDGSFVETIEHSQVDFEMVRSINEIGHIMGMKTIAEFVNTPGVRDMLAEIGVDYVQGYYIGQPQLLTEPA